MYHVYNVLYILYILDEHQHIRVYTRTAAQSHRKGGRVRDETILISILYNSTSTRTGKDIKEREIQDNIGRTHQIL